MRGQKLSPLHDVSGCCETNTLSSPLLTEAVRNINHAPVNLAAKVRDVMAPYCLPAFLLKIITCVTEGAKGFA